MKQAHWTRRTHLFRADEYICSACRASRQSLIQNNDKDFGKSEFTEEI